MMPHLVVREVSTTKGTSPQQNKANNKGFKNKFKIVEYSQYMRVDMCF
jgi:hypothetical protein